MTPLISIVIPVYNVEKYIDQCFDFILPQTLREIEIICINDGSTDDSLHILENYQHKDSRIQIISQENLGVSSARNRGIKSARGEYIYFVDPDDRFFSLTALEELYSHAKKFSLDILRHKNVYFNDSSARLEFSYWEDFSQFLPRGFNYDAFPPEACAPFFARIPRSVHGAIFRREFLLKYNLFFSREIALCEDVLFFQKSAILARRIGFLDKNLYLYRKNRNGSACTNYWKEYWKDRVRAFCDAYTFSKEHRAHPQIVQSLKKSAIEYLADDYASNNNIRWKNEMTEVLRSHIPTVFSQKDAQDESLIATLSPRGKLFLEWIYSNLTYSDFLRKKRKDFFRYHILKKITFGKRQKHYTEKLSAKF